MKRTTQERLPKEPVISIEEVTKLLTVIAKRQKKILEKMEAKRILEIPLSYLKMKSLPNLNLNN